MRSLLVVAALCLPGWAAAERLNVKPGLWEITSSSESSGMPPLPKELLDKMSPEQRAALEEEMESRAAEEPELDVSRECITEREVENPFASSNPDECTQEIVRTTATTQEVRLTCVGEPKGSGTLRISTPTPESMSGVLDITIGEGPEAMKIKADMKGRWLGEECGEEADGEEDEDTNLDEDEVDAGEEDEELE